MKKVSTAVSKQSRNFSQPSLTTGLDLGGAQPMTNSNNMAESTVFLAVTPTIKS